MSLSLHQLAWPELTDDERMALRNLLTRLREIYASDEDDPAQARRFFAVAQDSLTVVHGLLTACYVAVERATTFDVYGEVDVRGCDGRRWLDRVEAMHDEASRLFSQLETLVQRAEQAMDHPEP